MASMRKRCTPRSKVTYVVVKGNLDNMGEHRRWYDAMAIMEFVASAQNETVKVGEHSMMLTMDDIVGETALVNSQIVDYVDIQKGDDRNGVMQVVKALNNRREDIGIPADVVGHGLIRQHLERMYMRYDTWRDE